MPRSFSINKARGFSLIEVLVATSILTIAMLGIFSMIASVMNESASIDERLGRADMTKMLEMSLDDGSICTYQINNSLGTSGQTFDSSKLGAASEGISFSALLASGSPTASPLIKVGETPSGYAKSLSIKSIQITNFSAGTSPDSWNAEFQIAFDPTKLIHQLKPAVVHTLLSTSGTGNIKTIVGCNSGVSLVGAAAVGGANTAGPPTLCKPITKVYAGSVTNCNEGVIGTTKTVMGCAASYIGTLCNTQ